MREHLFDGTEYVCSRCASSFEEPWEECPACGAEIKTGSRTVSETCPSCGAGFVSADKLLSFARPDGLAPFMIPPDRVDGLLRKECSRRLLAPGFS